MYTKKNELNNLIVIETKTIIKNKNTKLNSKLNFYNTFKKNAWDKLHGSIDWIWLVPTPCLSIINDNFYLLSHIFVADK